MVSKDDTTLLLLGGAAIVLLVGWDNIVALFHREPAPEPEPEPAPSGGGVIGGGFTLGGRGGTTSNPPPNAGSGSLSGPAPNAGAGGGAASLEALSASVRPSSTESAFDDTPEVTTSGHSFDPDIDPGDRRGPSRVFL